MDDEHAISEDKDEKTGSFIINVPDPFFSASANNFDKNHPLVTPLSPQEQDAINNLRGFSKSSNTEQLVSLLCIDTKIKVCMMEYSIYKFYYI